MLQKSEELTLVPCKLGLLGEDQNLNIKNQKIGDKYTDVITHALNAKKIENLNLSDNRIT